MKLLIKVVTIVLSIAYPFMVYWGLQNFQASKLLPLLLILLALRWLVGNRASERMVLVAILIGVVIIAFTGGHQLGLKFYPVMVNFGFLIIFGGSLVFPPSMVERLARIREPNLSPGGVAYTFKVTWVWSVFFLINGSIAAITALWASNEVWALYNGFVAYLLIGILAGAEWIVRRRVIQHD
jgi:uncharacterized membrane protein